MNKQEQEALKTTFRKHRWTLEELVIDQKMQEANRLISGDANAMYSYLRECFGSGLSVLVHARSLLRDQRERRKTLGIIEPTKFKKRCSK